MSNDEHSERDEQDGQVSEANSLKGAGEPVSDSQAVAGQPTDESGEVNEGPTGPNARAGAEKN